MALSNPIVFSGIQSVDFINKQTKVPLGKLRVLQSVEMSEDVAKVDLMGGSQRSPWATTIGATTRNLTISANEFPSWLLELVSAGIKTDRSAEESGNVSAIVGANSFNHATKGVNVVSSTAANLKSGRYILKATAAKIFEVYLVGANVNAGSFTNDSLLLFTVDLATGTSVQATYGLTFTEKDTCDLTVGDIAYFDVRAINSKSYNVKFGSEESDFRDVEIYIAGQLTNGKQAILHIYRAQGAGMPLSFNKDAFSEYSLEFSILYCSSLDGTHEIEYIETGASSEC